jgi:drug/metabolite transporter (DMT)-like permease
MDRSRSTTRLGVGFGLLAAFSFGASAPFAQRLVAHCDPQLLAGLLYLGAGLALMPAGLARRQNEARVQRRDLPALAAIVISGGVIAPVLLLIGLDQVSGVTGSLALNLEAPFTAVLAVWMFGEYLSRRAWLAGLVIVAGATILGSGPGGSTASLIGVALIALACIGWSIDNNLTQRLTVRDPFVIVRIKTFGAAGTNLAIALSRGVGLPAGWVTVAALALGAVSYGLSVLFDAYALRLLGAAREAALFATAPFAGVVVAVVVLDERLSVSSVVALVVMACGTAGLLTDRHQHAHQHAALEHDHRHVHDDHHQHTHARGVDTHEPHSHLHQHEDLVHTHAHASDIHHRHKHRRRPGSPHGRIEG